VIYILFAARVSPLEDWVLLASLSRLRGLTMARKVMFSMSSGRIIYSKFCFRLCRERVYSLFKKAWVKINAKSKTSWRRDHKPFLKRLERKLF